ncbi:MAG: hypothetical protein EBR10_10070 [Planctomycetes bacterium]|nr:hypothetical protein [Planctomycetota bacterium]
MTGSDLNERLRRVRALVLDVDGTLTDGSILINDLGQETKRFDVRDGLGLELWRRAGLAVAVVTGRRGLALEHRLRELKITVALQAVTDKARGFADAAAQLGVPLESCAFMGDDLPDLAAMRFAAVACAPADAAAEVREAAHVVTRARGGFGAVREFIETVLKAQGKWDGLVRGGTS